MSKSLTSPECCWRDIALSVYCFESVDTSMPLLAEPTRVLLLRAWPFHCFQNGKFGFTGPSLDLYMSESEQFWGHVLWSKVGHVVRMCTWDSTPEKIRKFRSQPNTQVFLAHAHGRKTFRTEERPKDSWNSVLSTLLLPRFAFQWR